MNRAARGLEAHNRDVEINAGYLYTTNNRLSSQLAVQRHHDVLLGLDRFAGRGVLDMGCGDGVSTRYIWDHAHPKAMVGIDPAHAAIAVANASKGDRPIQFEVGSANRLAYPDDSFEVVLLKSVLHHDDAPHEIIREAFRLAPQVVIQEPNGNNLGLKIIEKISRYHREHGERSFSPRRIDRWIKQAGGRVVDRRFAGLVPIFSPDWFARAMKAMEPTVERSELLSAWCCALYVLVAERER